MRVITILAFIVKFINAIQPNNYPYNPNIHNLGNTGFFGKIHAVISPEFIKYTDKRVYGYNLREHVIKSFNQSKSF